MKSLSRIADFQPATWWGHGLIALAVYAIVRHWAGPVVVLFYFVGKETANYEYHVLKRHSRRVWLVDGALDLVGPVSVAAWAYFGHPLVLVVAAGLLGIGTLVWPVIEKERGVVNGG